MSALPHLPPDMENNDQKAREPRLLSQCTRCDEIMEQDVFVLHLKTAHGLTRVLDHSVAERKDSRA